jgi:hypothetical protein
MMSFTFFPFCPGQVRQGMTPSLKIRPEIAAAAQVSGGHLATGSNEIRTNFAHLF